MFSGGISFNYLSFLFIHSILTFYCTGSLKIYPLFSPIQSSRVCFKCVSQFLKSSNVSTTFRVHLIFFVKKCVFLKTSTHVLLQLKLTFQHRLFMTIGKLKFLTVVALSNNIHLILFNYKTQIIVRGGGPPLKIISLHLEETDMYTKFIHHTVIFMSIKCTINHNFKIFTLERNIFNFSWYNEFQFQNSYGFHYVTNFLQCTFTEQVKNSIST